MSHSFCSSCCFKQLAHHNAKADDNANASQRSSKAGGNGIYDSKGLAIFQRNSGKRHSADNPNDNCTDNKCQKRLYFCF